MTQRRSGFLVVALIVAVCGAVQAADTVHVGDLVIDSPYVIENQTYEQRGNITILPGGELILRNASLLLDQDWRAQSAIRLEGDASLSLEQSTIQSLYAYPIYMADTSTMATVGATGLSEGQLVLRGQAKASLQNAEVLNVSVGDSAILEASGCRLNEVASTIGGTTSGALTLLPGYHSLWSLKAESSLVDVPFDIRLSDTVVSHWNADIGGQANVSLTGSNVFQVRVMEQAAVTIVGSVVAQPVVDLTTGQHGTISSSQPGFVTYWTLGSIDPYATADLTLIDSVIQQGLYVRLLNTSATISDSNVIGLALFGSDGGVDVSGSVIGTLQLFACSASLQFLGSTVGQVWNPHDSTVELSGAVTFTRTSTTGWDSPWVNSTVSRTYDVQLQIPEPGEAVGQSVELLDPAGQLVSTAVTDQNGQVQFEIDFDDSNYLGTWQLRVPDAGMTHDVRLLSGTPIILAVLPPVPVSLSQLLAARFDVPEATIEALLDEYGADEVLEASEIAVSFAQLELRLGGCAIVSKWGSSHWDLMAASRREMPRR
jgi:hypothetical protein